MGRGRGSCTPASCCTSTPPPPPPPFCSDATGRGSSLLPAAHVIAWCQPPPHTSWLPSLVQMVLGVTLLYSLLHITYVSFGNMKETDIPLLLVGRGAGGGG